MVSTSIKVVSGLALSLFAGRAMSQKVTAGYTMPSNIPSGAATALPATGFLGISYETFNFVTWAGMSSLHLRS